MGSPFVFHPHRTIGAIQAEWAALKLKILKPVDAEAINPYQWVAITEAPWTLDPLRRELPVTVAHLRADAVERHMEWARRQNERCDRYWIDGGLRTNKDGMPYAPPEFLQDFHDDISDINRVLFRKDIDRARITGGLFRTAVAPPLHMDELPRGGVHYICRAGALPFEMISGRAILRMLPETREIVMAARARDEAPATLAAMDALRQAKILNEFALGAVVMMFGPGKRSEPNPPPFQPKDGTLHCSSPVPPEGDFSMLYRAASYLAG